MNDLCSEGSWNEGAQKGLGKKFGKLHFFCRCSIAITICIVDKTFWFCWSRQISHPVGVFWNHFDMLPEWRWSKNGFERELDFNKFIIGLAKRLGIIYCYEKFSNSKTSDLVDILEWLLLFALIPDGNLSKRRNVFTANTTNNLWKRYILIAKF